MTKEDIIKKLGNKFSFESLPNKYYSLYFKGKSVAIYDSENIS